jgi:hypothetical protein
MSEEKQMSDSEKKKEDWMNSKWRPMMGWMYMAVCSADFILFPILWSVVQTVGHGSVNVQWQPITLQGAGLFHIAMGAVLGIAAMGRTQEKLAGANNGGAGNGYVPPPPVQPSAAAPSSGGFGNFGSPAPAAQPASMAPAANSFNQAPVTPTPGMPSFGKPAIPNRPLDDTMPPLE